MLGMSGNDSKHDEGNWDILRVSVTLLEVTGTTLGATGTMLGTTGTLLEATGITLGVTGLWQAQHGEEQEDSSHPSPTNTPYSHGSLQPLPPPNSPLL